MNSKAAAILLVGLCSGAASTAWGQAWSFKNTNVHGAFTSPVKERSAERVEAFIGRRAAMRSGERSALRWLSRLLKQHPQAQTYVVEWYVRAGGKWWNVAALYEKGGLAFLAARSSVEANPPFPDRSWDVSAAQIHNAARRGRTFRAFGRGET